MRDNDAVLTGLNGLLADATVFYQKLRHYHWNVDGRHFFELHAKFEEIYDGWAATIDQVAERILMVDGVPLHTLRSLLEASTIREDDDVPQAPQMVDAIVNDLQVLHSAAGRVIDAADEAGDRGTVNLLDGLRDGIEKDLWMLRAWRKEKTAAWS